MEEWLGDTIRSPWRTWEEVKLNFRNKGSGKAGCIPLIYNMVERALL